MKRFDELALIKIQTYIYTHTHIGAAECAVAQKKMPNDHLDERLGDPEKRVELEFFDKELPAAAFFDLDDLLRASAEVLGKGKLGTSYKVTLESGSVVVVKRLRTSMNELSKKEFVQQMQLLGKMRHENLVQILSFYYCKEEKLVIYKFISGATTLFELLHGQFNFSISIFLAT